MGANYDEAFRRFQATSPTFRSREQAGPQTHAVVRSKTAVADGRPEQPPRVASRQALQYPQYQRTSPVVEKRMSAAEEDEYDRKYRELKRLHEDPRAQEQKQRLAAYHRNQRQQVRYAAPQHVGAHAPPQQPVAHPQYRPQVPPPNYPPPDVASRGLRRGSYPGCNAFGVGALASSAAGCFELSRAFTSSSSSAICNGARPKRKSCGWTCAFGCTGLDAATQCVTVRQDTTALERPKGIAGSEGICIALSLLRPQSPFARPPNGAPRGTHAVDMQYDDPEAWPPSAIPEIPQLQQVSGSAVDISTLMQQRRQVDEAMQEYQQVAEANAVNRVDDPTRREAEWRREREFFIERLRREISERERLVELERHRLDEKSAQLQQRRLRNSTRELEIKRYRLQIEEKSTAMAEDFRVGRRKAIERETAYQQLGTEVDPALENYRRDLEDDARDVRAYMKNTKRHAASILDEELLMNSLDAERASRLREQHQRDILAWKREQGWTKDGSDERKSRAEMLMEMQAKHYEALVTLGTRDDRGQIGNEEAHSRKQIEDAENVLRCTG
eukprot:gene14134-21656_t